MYKIEYSAEQEKDKRKRKDLRDGRIGYVDSVIRVLRLEGQLPVTPLRETLDGVVTKVSSRWGCSSHLPAY